MMAIEHGEPMRGLDEVPEFDVFVYPASPWNESLAGVSERLADIFPTAGPKAGNGLHGPDRGMFQSGNQAARNRKGDASGDGSPETERISVPVEEDWPLRLSEECRKAEARGRSQGMDAGAALGRQESAMLVEREREGERERLQAQLRALSESFDETRTAYFQEVEREVVHLALAIAARILRREAQMDPLLLTGAVRVALGQLAETTAVRLRVPVRDRAMWEEAMARMPGLALRPEVVGDERMALGECRMEAEIGSADLGLWPQLKEIERGFFDRVEARNGYGVVEDASGPREDGPAAEHEEFAL